MSVAMLGLPLVSVLLPALFLAQDAVDLLWIISIAQHARPKVIGHRLPVRAQFTTLSRLATTKPFRRSRRDALHHRILFRTRRQCVAVPGDCRIVVHRLTPTPARPCTTHR